MKQVECFLFLLVCALTVNAQIDVPPSGGNPRAFVSEEVGITTIGIKYSKPRVNGREGKIWGGLVTKGFSTFNLLTNKNSSPWRAGANEATVISFEHDIKLEGREMKAGSYALFIAFDMDSSTLIFSKQTEAWGSFYYKEEDDVMRVKVKPLPLDKSVEWLTYRFTEHNETNCTVALQWEKLSIPFRIDVDVDNITVNNFRAQLIGLKGLQPDNLLYASMYCFKKGINTQEALQWAQKAVNGKPFGPTHFDAYMNLSNGYLIAGRKSDADSAMKEALVSANMTQYINYGRNLITQKRYNDALEVILNAKTRFGDMYAVNNALSYAYSAKGEFNKALEFANKALAQAVTPQAKASVSANIEKLKAGKDIN